MSDETKVSYKYDPLSKSGNDRWGHKGAEKHTPPDVPNYEFLDVLGAGGMGVVWSAKYKPLNQTRAVKVLNPAIAMDAKFLEKFGEEAKVLASLEHPFIVKVYDVSADPECPYIAMDFVAGRTLNDLMKRGPIPEVDAIRYFRQIADALDHAHMMGFVHRDIKPSNILISNTGNAMLIDFGVATLMGGDGDRSKTMIGTARYMSPEACRGDRVTKSSDLWAFAVLMYRVLTGGFPFDGKKDQEIMACVLSAPVMIPQHRKRRVREYLVRALAKEPSERPATATEMAEKMRRALKPWVFRTHGEQLTIGASVAGFAAILVLGIGGVIWRASMVKPKPVVIVKTNTIVTPGGKTIVVAAPGAEGKTKPGAGAGAAAAATELAQLKGVWYGDFGDHWSEIHLTPTEGAKFHATIQNRDQSGVANQEVDGELAAGHKLTYQVAGDPGSTEKTSAPIFAGQVSEDGSRVTGKRTEDGGQSTDGFWVRARDLPTTPYDNSQLQFTVPVPAGWSTSAGDSVAFSPIGRPDVVFSVTSALLNGAATIDEVFQAREKQMMDGAAGSYQNIGVNPSASLGSRPAVNWEFTTQGASGTRHAIFQGVLRGENSLTIECWWPTSEEDVWPPVLEMMRRRFAFTD